MANQRIACTVRFDGTNWGIINYSNHQPVGVSSVYRIAVAGGYGLRLDYSFTASKVEALVVTSDETFAGVYHAGASVGLAHSIIHIKNSSGALIDPNTVGTVGNFWIMGSFEV